jgi:hypothetical protein
VRCKLDVVSVQVARWGKVGTVMRGNFVLFIWKLLVRCTLDVVSVQVVRCGKVVTVRGGDFIF